MISIPGSFPSCGSGGRDNLGLLQRLSIAGRAMWFYAGKLAWPDPLIFVYPRWPTDPRAEWHYRCPAAALAVLVGLWWAGQKDRPWSTCGRASICRHPRCLDDPVQCQSVPRAVPGRSFSIPCQYLHLIACWPLNRDVAAWWKSASEPNPMACLAGGQLAISLRRWPSAHTSGLAHLPRLGDPLGEYHRPEPGELDGRTKSRHGARYGSAKTRQS